MHDDASSPEQLLNGWKDIAAYLGKSVRSVQRWEATLGLPVRRIRTPGGQIVYAEKTEVDEWRQSRDFEVNPPTDDPLAPDSPPEPNPSSSPASVAPALRSRFRAQWMAAGAVVLFISGGLFGWALGRPSAVAVSLAFAGHSLQGLNHRGVVVWSYEFERDVSSASAAAPPLV